MRLTKGMVQTDQLSATGDNDDDELTHSNRLKVDIASGNLNTISLLTTRKPSSRDIASSTYLEGGAKNAELDKRHRVRRGASY